MAYITATTAPARPGLLRRSLTAIGDVIVFIFSIGPMAEEVRRLNRQSDADLAARGTTRAAEVHRIFGPRSLL